jgi:hypothetical protein
MLYGTENSTTWLSSFELYPGPVGYIRSLVFRRDLRISDAGLPALSDIGNFDWDHGVPDLYLGLSPVGFAIRTRAPCPVLLRAGLSIRTAAGRQVDNPLRQSVARTHRPCASAGWRATDAAFRP